MNNEEVVQKIADTLKNSNNFLISTHVNPDGDAVGSILAIFHVLKEIGKKVTMVIDDEVPEKLAFLPGASQIKKYSQLTEEELSEFEIFIVTDLGRTDNLGRLVSLIDKYFTINIDHHKTNQNFGTLNWNDPGASSLGEVLFQLFKEYNLPISRKSALCMYETVLSDTGSFRYNKTTSNTFLIASQLLEYGISPWEVSSALYEQNPARVMKLLGDALSHMTLIKNEQIAILTFTKDMLKKHKCADNDPDGLINYARGIENVEIAISIEENTVNEEINVVLRSRGNISVVPILEKFDGKGSFNGGSFVTKDSITNIKKDLELIMDEILF